MRGCRSCDGWRRSFHLGLEGGVSTIVYVLKKKSELFSGLYMLICKDYQQAPGSRSALPSYSSAVLIEAVLLGH
jgi:hypothetical protein